MIFITLLIISTSSLQTIRFKKLTCWINNNHTCTIVKCTSVCNNENHSEMYICMWQWELSTQYYMRYLFKNLLHASEVQNSLTINISKHLSVCLSLSLPHFENIQHDWVNNVRNNVFVKYILKMHEWINGYGKHLEFLQY